MFRLLNQPYPREENPLKRLRFVSISAVIVFLFLWVFRPFGIDRVEVESLDLFIAGYGLVTFLVAGLLVVVVPILIPAWFQESGWTIGKNILFYTILITGIGLGNTFYTAKVLGKHVGPEGFLFFQISTLSVGAVVASMFTLLRYTRNLRFHEAEAKSLDQELHEQAVPATGETIVLTAENGKESLSLKLDDLLFIESADNYSSVCYREGKLLRRQLLRGSLRMLEQQLSGSSIVRCHRSYLVNLRSVRRITGNSQGYRAHFENLEDGIPVSRKAGPELHRYFRRS
ncbi:MAG TPA: LytTR family DNA-binding domain-containing protein [Bacteroidia bacterium]|nr:LytTR family transcriptional regulator [Bacteroidia bacterium]HRI41304.1 LytTR family DNA-binding domain-containing protein [Bacteroidia bacterium]HRS38852.1 LytTR family DNA-binding domain-containing protein [Bacteroidia bacterium]HRU62212.1 LytTR family DNA-binding domain-containing protein [Bacteroidia bacterium]